MSMNLNADLDEDEKAKKLEEARKQLGGIPLIGPALTNSPLAGIAGNLFSMMDRITEQFNEVAFKFLANKGWGVSPAQVPAKVALFSTIESSNSFSDVTSALGLDPSVASTLKSICKNTTKNLYGITGLPLDPKALAETLLHCHDQLSSTLTKALIAKGTPINDAKTSAVLAASQILGINTEHGISDDLLDPKKDLKFLESSLTASMPTDGLAGMLFQTQEKLTANPNAASIEVAALIINTSELKQTLNAAAAEKAAAIAKAEAEAKAAADKAKGAAPTTHVTGGTTPSIPPTAPPPTPAPIPGSIAPTP